MSDDNVIDVSRFRPLSHGREATVWWGVVGMIVVETMVFSSLLASYFYLRLTAVAWPPAGVDPPPLMLSTIATGTLVTSSFLMHRGDVAIHRGEVTRMCIWHSLAALVAAGFLVLKGLEFGKLDFRWDSHAYGSIFWLVLSFHAVHVTALFLKTVVITAFAIRGRFTRRDYLGVEVNSLYWHFVVIAWVPIYFVLYFTPRVLG